MRLFLLILFLAGCTASYKMPEAFIYAPVHTDGYEIATWQKQDYSSPAPVHIYIEGDGNSFDSAGFPTDDPTPRGSTLREIAASDKNPSVVYIGRPCQYIMSESCSKKDWTTGRFSEKVIDSVAQVIKKVSYGRPVVLIGYSGGAMVSGLVIQNNPDIIIEKWITLAGVLNHQDWTEYFGDAPLIDSLNLEKLPDVPQIHYIAENDEVVPNELSCEWLPADKVVKVPKATHSDLNKLNIFE